ncbi:MAG: hypothetical protein ACPGRD_06315, partial [Planktomarina sp.]
MSDQGFWNRNFVWWSSEDSIRNEKISVLACAEVVLSVTAFWWIAWYFDTYVHLWSSLIIAPLVLLRSDKSVLRALVDFNLYLREFNGNKSISANSAKGVLCIFSTLLLSLLPILAWFLVTEEKSPLNTATISIYVALFCYSISLHAILMLVYGPRNFGNMIIGLLPVAIIALMACIWLLTFDILKSVNLFVAFLASLPLGVYLGGAAGFVLKVLYIRSSATFAYLHEGLPTFVNNWRENLFYIDTKMAPEILPDPNNYIPSVKLKHLFQTVRRDFGWGIDGVSFRLLLTSLGLIIFVPSMLYRYSIKSTCWFYFPLIYLTAKLPETRLIWARAYSREVMTRVSVVMALITIILFGFAAVQPAELARLL